MFTEKVPSCTDVRECLPYFRMLFDSIRIGVMIADTEGRLVYYNGAQSEIDRLSADDVVGRTMYEVYHYTSASSPAMNVLRSGAPVVDRVNSYRTRSGNLVNASCTIYPLQAGGGDILGVVCYSQSYTALDMQVQNVERGIRADRAAGESVSARTPQSGTHYTFDSLVGASAGLREAERLARIAAGSVSTTMLVGETGVGKEIFAQSIHYEGERAAHPYTAINCSAVPETLLEGILFGTSKGAFTGALNRPGLFEVSHRGTIFLDEVDSMPVSLQSKLLRVLQDKKIRRVGEAREREVDVRIISAVGRNPGSLLEQGVLRPDFYYRLGVIKIFIPPLRERVDDLPLLVRHFLYRFSARLSRPAPAVEGEAVQVLRAHSWPGNVRELEHALEAAVNIMGAADSLSAECLRSACPDIAGFFPADDGEAGTRGEGGSDGAGLDAREDSGPVGACAGVVGAAPVPGGVSPASPSAEAGDKLQQACRDTEVGILGAALRKAAGNRTTAARLLGISPQLLYYKMKKYKLRADDFTPKNL